MSKVNEPTAAYYSVPQINALKKKLKASIERENDVEVLLRYESMMCTQTMQKTILRSTASRKRRVL